MGPRQLSSAEKRLLLFRLIFLHYKERLETYLALIKEENYRPEDYLEFRTRNLVNIAISFAEEELFDFVKVLITRHSSRLLPWRLVILNHIVEIIPPSRYADLLPEIDPDSGLEVFASPFEQPRDWMDVDWIYDQLGLADGAHQDLSAVLHLYAKEVATAVVIYSISYTYRPGSQPMIYLRLTTKFLLFVSSVRTSTHDNWKYQRL